VAPRRSSGDSKKEKGPRRSRAFRIALQVAAVGLVAFFAYRERDLFRGFASTMSSLIWYWVVLAFVTELASIPPLAETQLVILRAAGTKADRWQMNLVTLASNAIAISVPVGVAVAEGFAYAWYRRMGANTAVAAWAELASGAVAFSALAGVALVGAVIAGGPALPILLPILSIVFAGAFGAAVLFRHPHVLIKAIDWIEAHVGRHLGRLVAKGAERIREVSHRLSGVHPSIPTWGVAFGLSAANWLLDVVALAVSFLAVGGKIPWGAVLLAFAGSKVVSSIGITPGGLGIVEGGLVAVFVALGTNGPTAVGAVLVYRVITFLGLGGLGWVATGVLAVETHRGARRRSVA
jgi:putative heme transporter